MAGKIVVGADSSPGAVAALRWALNEARIRDASVEVVHAWQYPYMADMAYLAAAQIDRTELQADAKAQITTALERAGADEDVRIEEYVAEGSAAMVLVERARDADLLVVGTRGHGGFAGLLLGSVSQQVAHHAPCPVVIVPLEE